MLNGAGGKTFLHYRAYAVSGDIAYEPGPVTISVTPGYTHTVNRYLGDFDFSENGIPRAAALGSTTSQGGSRETNDATSIEARAKTNFDGVVNLMVGGYYQHFIQRLAAPAILPGTRENTLAPAADRYVTVDRSSTIGNTFAGFAQVMIDVTPSLNISGGLRYTHETKDSVLDQFYANPASTYVAVRFARDQTFNNTSPEATVT